MGNFFRPLRRKTGVVTLILAFAFAGWWVRSLVVRDLIMFSYGRPTWELLESGYGSFVWARNHDEIPMWFPPRWETEMVSEAKSPLNEPQLEWEWRCCGFGVAKYAMGPGRVIPYWSIVVPLTFISLWLLLTNPRESSQMKIPERATK